MGAAYTRQDFIAEQLIAAAPGADWHAQGVDRAQELAGFFIRAGITDLSRLTIAPVWVPIFYQLDGSYDFGDALGNLDPKYAGARIDYVLSTTTDPGGYTGKALFLQFSYGGKRIGFLGDTNGGPAGGQFLHKTSVAFSAAGHGHVDYYATPDAQGHLTFVPIWGSSSDLAAFHDALKGAVTWAAVVFPVVGIAAGSIVGGYILGPTLSAQYPALATAVGNAAIGTAMNGGNVAAAVKSAALGSAGGAAGATVGGAVVNSTSSVLLGKVAASATAAFVQGGDVKNAVTTALLQNGYQSMDAAFNFNTSALDALSAGTDASGNPLTVPSDYGLSSQVSLTNPYADTSLSPIFDPALSYQLTSGLVPAAPQLPISSVQAPADTSSPLTPAPSSSGFDFSTVVKDVSQAAMAGLKLVQAYNVVSGKTGVNTTARYVAPNGTVTTATDSGLIQVQNPNGSITSSIPPKGQPQATVGGNVIVNNGDGTFTSIDPNGNRTIHQYASTPAGAAAVSASSGLSSLFKSPAVIAAAIGAVVAFSRK